MSIEKPSFTISTLQEVTREVSTKAIVGFEKTEDLPLGWQFDIKRWSSVFDRRLPVLPRLSNPSYQGLNTSEYFKSGVSDPTLGDFNLLSIAQLDYDFKTTWTPIVKPGTYFRYNNNFVLFSDDSIVQYIDSSENESDRNVILLDRQPSIDTDIVAIIYKRDEVSKHPRKHIEAKLVGEFSGVYVSEEEQETVDELGTINWSNVDTTKKEFVLDTSYEDKYYLRFNKDYTFSIGREITSYDEIGVCENIGVATGEDSQIFYTKYFPVVPEDVHVYVADGTSSFAEWTQVDSFFELQNSTNSEEYYVDKDIGAICFGSDGNAPAEDMYIMVTYSVTMRIEYEPFDSENKIIALDADLNPVNQSQNQAFVCITHDTPEAANISLVIDKSIISGTDPTEYGPIYTGSDFAILRAEVTDINDLPVPKIEVDFSLSNSLGYLASSSSLSNGAGYSFTSYQPPTNSNSLGFYSQTVRPSEHASYPAVSYKEIIIYDTDANLTDKEEDVFVYQILKDDLFLGYEDLDSYIVANIDSPAWVGTLGDPDYATNFARWKEELILEYGWREWVVPGSPDIGQDIDGRKVVIYQIGSSLNVDVSALDPDYGTTGFTVVPVKPELTYKITDVLDPHYGKWSAIYPIDAIPDVTGNVAGYWLGTSRLVKFKASCWSPYYNKTIESDEIIGRISPPSYMLGEYVFDGDKVPYGWKLPDEFNDIASAIGGITFITINPKVTPYNVIEVIGSSTTDDYVSNQFNTKVFEFEIEE